MRKINLFGILIALVLIVWGIAPFLNHELITNNVLASSIILVMIGIAYPIIVFKPEWNKAVLFFEGIIIACVGYIFLTSPYNIVFAILGIIILIISILAYLRKLPNSLLKFFYK